MKRSLDRTVIGRLLAGLGYYLGLAVATFLGAIWATGLFDRSWELPLFYRSDALSGGSQFKGTLENGWYEINPALGAPHGQVMHAFPLADNLQFAVARVLGMFTDQWSVAYNLAYLLTYPAAAVAGAWFLRRLGVSRLSAFVVGVLFAFAPYHFMHGLPHLSLSMYFTVPLALSLSMAVMLGRPVWARRAGGSARNPITWLSATTLGTLFIAALVGTTSSYYAVFGLLFLGFAILVAGFERRWRDAIGGIGAAVSIVVVMLMNMAPDILWARSTVDSPAAFARAPLEAELYGLKFTSLIFPVHWNRIGDLGAWRFTYDETFPLPGERAALGVVAALGFVVLLALPIVLLIRGRRGDWWPSRRISSLSLFAWIGFAFGMVGGLATIFALLISPDIRAWNRIVMFLMLISLSVVAISLDHGTGWVRRRVADRGRLAVLVAPVLALALLGGGLFDQVAPKTWALIGDEQARWDNDKAYVADIESRVPADTMVYQLPAVAFPESLPVNDMEDYELMRPYLHSTDMRWTYGGLKGRPKGDWATVASQLPTDRLVVALAAAGFGGIHIDRFGYPSHDTSVLEGDISRLVGVDPVESPDGRFAFFDLGDFVADVEDERSRKWLDNVGNHLVNPPMYYWQQDFNPPFVDPEGSVVLPGKGPAIGLDLLSQRVRDTPVRLTFTLRADGATGPTPVRITWPDGDVEEVIVGVDGLAVDRKLDMAPGASEVGLSASGVTSISLINLVINDPVLAFPLDTSEAEKPGSSGRESGERE